MSSAVLSLSTGSRSAISPWFVGAAAVIPRSMEAVSTTIVGVARPHIAGGPTAHFGRRNYFFGPIALFTIGSGLCGPAVSPPQLILFRVIQGLGAGGLQPSTQAILLSANVGWRLTRCCRRRNRWCRHLKPIRDNRGAAVHPGNIGGIKPW